MTREQCLAFTTNGKKNKKTLKEYSSGSISEGFSISDPRYGVHCFLQNCAK
uniref:Uncharacterized protein n=1 Tax=Anguilla anguilla TaxID=7936 RepID=A0A0E9QB17_ANGAN